MAAVAPVAAGAAPAVGAAAVPVTGRWYAVFGSASFLPRPSRSRQDCLGPRGGGGSQTGTPLSGRACALRVRARPLVRGVRRGRGRVRSPTRRARVAPVRRRRRARGTGRRPTRATGWVAAGWVVVPACVAPGRRPLGAQLVTGAGRWPAAAARAAGFADGAVRGASCAGVRAWPPFGEVRTGLAEGWVRGAARTVTGAVGPAVRAAPVREPASSSRFSWPSPLPLLPRPFGVPF